VACCSDRGSSVWKINVSIAVPQANPTGSQVEHHHHDQTQLGAVLDEYLELGRERV